MRLGTTEIILIVVLALVLFGGSKLAGVGKALGTSYSQTPTTARRVTLTAGMGDVVLTTTE